VGNVGSTFLACHPGEQPSNFMKGVFERVYLQPDNIFRNGRGIIQELKKEVQVVVMLFQEIPTILSFESKCWFKEFQHIMEHLR
jgi:hypothetical protein